MRAIYDALSALEFVVAMAVTGFGAVILVAFVVWVVYKIVDHFAM